MPSSDPHAGTSGISPDFVSTHWSVVLLAGQKHSPQSAAALDKLCRAYWYPLYAFARRAGHSPEAAADSTQEFFSRLLADNALTTVDRTKGRFRSFLLAAMSHLLANEWKHARRQKRGGGQPHFSIDAVAAEDRYQYEPVDELSPDRLFDRRWAESLLDRVIERLRTDWDGPARRVRFDDVKVFVLDRKGVVSFADAAARLQTTVPTIKSAVQKLRLRYREIFREEIAHTVAHPTEVEEEIRHLFAALG